MGRPRLKGKRLPNLSAVIEEPATAWSSIAVRDWYGEGERVVEIATATAVWYSTGLYAVPLRWTLVRDPRGAFATQALLCTDLDADPKRILSWFVMRWQLEATFQEARRHLGVETQRQCSDLAIQRTTPALLGLFSLVTLFLGASADDTHRKHRPADGMAPQSSSELFRGVGAGTPRIVGARDFSRVVLESGHGRSPSSIGGPPNRGGLLCSVMAKVELRVVSGAGGDGSICRMVTCRGRNRRFQRAGSSLPPQPQTGLESYSPARFRKTP